LPGYWFILLAENFIYKKEKDGKTAILFFLNNSLFIKVFSGILPTDRKYRQIPGSYLLYCQQMLYFLSRLHYMVFREA
jgi:hypothetical protein